MILISHRGNTIGRNPKRENAPDYISEALKSFDVEIDVWFLGKFYLGHDGPDYEIDFNFLKQKKLWCHAKNVEALEKMMEKDIHCFYHQTDDCVLTSKGFIWTFPGRPLTSKSIAVLPENTENLNCCGICCDSFPA